MPGALGRSDFAQSAPSAFGPSLRVLAQALAPSTLMLPGHDYDDRFATTLDIESAAQPLLDGVLRGSLDAAGFASAKETLERDLGLTEYRTMACGARVDRSTAETTPELTQEAFAALRLQQPDMLLVDVREPYEQRLGQPPGSAPDARLRAVPLSGLLNALPGWLALPEETPRQPQRTGSQGAAPPWPRAGLEPCRRPGAVATRRAIGKGDPSMNPRRTLLLAGCSLGVLSAAAAAVAENRKDPVEGRFEKLRDFTVDKLPLQDAIRIVHGAGQRRIAVFSDPNCGHCKRVDRDLKAIGNVT
eukprot:gene9272-12522_t